MFRSCLHPPILLLLIVSPWIVQILTAPLCQSSPSPSHGHKSARPELDAAGISSVKIEGLLRAKENRKAYMVFEDAVKRPENAEARSGWLSALLSAENKEDEAIAQFKQVKHVDKVNSYALYLIAKAYFQTGDYVQTKRLCDLVIARGDCGECYELRAACYDGDKRYLEAAQDYDKAASAVPRYAGSFYGKAAQSLLKANQPDKALNMIDKALNMIDKAPSMQKGELDAPSLVIKGQCLARLNRNEEAIKMFTRVLAIPDSSKWVDSRYLHTNCLLERARCYDKIGKKALAAADRKTLEQLTKAVESELIGK